MQQNILRVLMRVIQPLAVSWVLTSIVCSLSLKIHTTRNTFRANRLRNKLFMSQAERLVLVSPFTSSHSPLLSSLASTSSSTSSKLIDKTFETVIDSSLSQCQLSELPNVNSVFLVHEDCCNNDSILNNQARKHCKYDFFVPKHSSPAYQNLKFDEFKTLLLKRFESFIQTIRKPSKFENNDSSRRLGKWSHFLSLTYPSIDEALPYLSELRIGIDAYELRVDLLKDKSDFSILRQIALLRDFSPLPLVYTVRTEGQLGKFPLIPSKPIFDLLRLGARANVEYLDVEGCLPEAEVLALFNEINTTYSRPPSILGSLHVTTPQTENEIKDMLRLCNLGGCADILKVVTGADTLTDCELVHKVCSENVFNKPYIGLSLGERGAPSRISNKRFTPVTHKLMAAAAPGQLTVEELMSERQKLKLISPKNYYLFGTPIKHSMSPFMHNAAFKALLLPHKYDIFEADIVDAYKSIIEDDDFGGASVTIPHKENIIPMLDEIVGAAKEIGAVNTIVIENREILREDGQIEFARRKVGYNTDWLGILRPIERLLQSQPKVQSKSRKQVGIVIGAGGTAKAACYAIKQLGLDLVICNRTPEKALDIANKYGGKSMKLEDVPSALAPEDIGVVISTVPAHAEITLPGELLAHKPIVLDAAYKPPRTKLLNQALAAGCAVVQGATMLLEQGIEQFELWHQRRAPRIEMDEAVFRGIEKL